MRGVSEMETVMKCEGILGPCGRDTQKRKSMTLYEGVDVKTDMETLEQELIPDSGPVLCDECYAAYVGHWQAMWDEYYSGLL